MTRQELLDSLSSSVCPACNGAKTPRMTFCRKDYYALPKEMRQALYHRFGAGYEEAFQAAADFLQTRQSAANPEPNPPPQATPHLFPGEGAAPWTL